MLFTLVSVITSGTGAALLAKWTNDRRGPRADVRVPAGEPAGVGGPGLSPSTVASGH
jgi:hypothetical protein